MQLALFHALFTWLTLRMFETHFVYASTLASAIFALLPLIPSWLVALPAALQLFIQVDLFLSHCPLATALSSCAQICASRVLLLCHCARGFTISTGVPTGL